MLVTCWSLQNVSLTVGRMLPTRWGLCPALRPRTDAVPAPLAGQELVSAPLPAPACTRSFPSPHWHTCTFPGQERFLRPLTRHLQGSPSPCPAGSESHRASDPPCRVLARPGRPTHVRSVREHLPPRCTAASAAARPAASISAAWPAPRMELTLFMMGREAVSEDLGPPPQQLSPRASRQPLLPSLFRRLLLRLSHSSF